MARIIGQVAEGGVLPAWLVAVDTRALARVDAVLPLVESAAEGYIARGGAVDAVMPLAEVAAAGGVVGVQPLAVWRLDETPQSMLFAVNEYVSMGHASELDMAHTSDRTWSFWVRTTSTASISIVSKRRSGSPDEGYELAMIGGYQRLLLQGTGRMFVTSTTTPINDGEWHHVEVSWNGSAGTTATSAVIRVDGVTQSVTVGDNTLTGTVANTRPFQIVGVDGTLRTGAIEVDEVAMFDGLLTTGERSEVSADRNTDIMTTTAAAKVLGYWRMAEADTLPTISDLSGNANDGTATGGRLVVATAFEAMGSLDGDHHTADRWLSDVAGKVDRGVRYGDAGWTAGDAYTSMGDVLDFERTDELSICFWLRLPNGVPGDFVDLVSKYNGTAGYRVTLDPNIVFRKFGVGQSLSASFLPSLGTGWNHIAITDDGSSTAAGISIYLNGVAQPVTVGSDTLTSATTLNDGDFKIGGLFETSVVDIDDVAVFRRELTAAQVEAIYDAGDAGTSVADV